MLLGNAPPRTLTTLGFHDPPPPSTMDGQQEREIALGLREGKPEAWCALYDAFAPSIWQSVARWLGPRHAEIADIVQETFMAAARGARQYEHSRGSLATWLSGIARNKIALYFRREKRHEIGTDPDGAVTAARLLSWLENQQDDPPAALQAAELAGLVRATLTALPADYEALLVAKYIDGVSVDELAAAEQSTPVAVRSKLARARQAFREHFVKTTGYSSDSEERVL
jgi:RNA polymerase sigma-70 factor, ECF subfamily